MKQTKITIILDQPLHGHFTEDVVNIILSDPNAFGGYKSFSQDRVKVEEIDANITPVSACVKLLTEAIKSDDDLRTAWQANIAMAFKDEYFSRYKIMGNKPFDDAERAEVHAIANSAANKFLQLLCETNFINPSLRPDNVNDAEFSTLRDLLFFLQTLSEKQLSGPAHIFRWDDWGADITATYILSEDHFCGEEGIAPVSCFEPDPDDEEYTLENQTIIPKGTVYLVSDNEEIEEAKITRLQNREGYEELKSLYHELWGIVKTHHDDKGKNGVPYNPEKWQRGWSLLKFRR